MRTARTLVIGSILCIVVYVGLYFAALLADKMHGGGNSFGWSPAYFVIIPMELLSVLFSLAMLVLAVLQLVEGNVGVQGKK